MSENLWRDVGPRQPRPQPPRRTPLQITSGDPSAPRRPVSSPEARAAWSRRTYGACASCDAAFDADALGRSTDTRWLVGDEHSGISKCCSEFCAWTFYNQHVDEWDLARYGRCRAPGCDSIVRPGEHWVSEIQPADGDPVLFLACSNRCAWKLHDWLVARYRF